MDFEPPPEEPIPEEEPEEFEITPEMVCPPLDMDELVEEYDAEIDENTHELACILAKDPLNEERYSPLLCSICNIEITSVDAYLKHFKNLHQKKLEYCPLCCVFYSNMAFLMHHWRTIHAETFRKQKLETDNEIINRLINRKKSFACPHCSEVFTNKDKYRYISLK
jgi:hypothetical protein